MEQNSFDRDLKFGTTSEQEVGDYFVSEGYKVLYAEKGNPYYDLEISDKENTYTLEVKTDTCALATKNLLVELYKVKNGNLEKSGLSITQADYYIFKLSRRKGFYLIPTKTLKQLVENRKYKSMNFVGDNGSAMNAFFDLTFLLSHCEYYY